MEDIQFDGSLAIAVGSSRRCTSWQNREVMWSDLAKRLNHPTRTQETQEEYKSMPKAKRDALKDVGGFVGGVLKGGHRKADAVASRRLLTLDLDNLSKKDDPWQTVTLLMGSAAVLYSTHSHTPEKPRLRLVMPLSRNVTPDEYSALAHRVAGDIGCDLCDDTTYEPHRLMYWPSASFDAEFRYEFQDGPWLNVDEQLARYTDWRDPAQWPVSSRKSSVMKRAAAQQGDPLQKPGIVGAFCRAYSIEDAITTFLPDVYIPCGDGRWTFAGGSTAGGLVIYDNGKFAYSHHGTDPAGGKLCNAFDLVRIHLFEGDDDEVTPGTPANRYPSYQRMSDLAANDENVRQDLMQHRLEDMKAAFSEDEDTEWLKQLTVSAKGTIESTIDNVFTILLHDPDLRGRYYYDDFKERPIVSGDLPWIKRDRRQSFVWNDTDDAGLRMFLEKRYQLTDALKIRDAVDVAMLECRKHPVREYLENLVWDGTERADTIFVKYLGAEDTPYTRAVTRKSLIGAVARIFEPGCKHDHVLVLVGPQGCRKSTTLAKLGKNWFSDSLYTMNGKDAYELLQGSWIIELGEMAAARKSEVEAIKMFIAKQTDSFRAAYARRLQDHPRQCVFFGSTNDAEFLHDQTGARRFWPVEVTNEGRVLADALTDEIVDQIWAEAVVYYRTGEKWYLDDEIEDRAREVQELHTEHDDLIGLIEQFIDKPIPSDWNTRPLDARLLFWSGAFEDADQLVHRKSICALEIWAELMKEDVARYDNRTARRINGLLGKILDKNKSWEKRSRLPESAPYGQQRGYIYHNWA